MLSKSFTNYVMRLNLLTKDILHILQVDYKFRCIIKHTKPKEYHFGVLNQKSVLQVDYKLCN